MLPPNGIARSGVVSHLFVLSSNARTWLARTVDDGAGNGHVTTWGNAIHVPSCGECGRAASSESKTRLAGGVLHFVASVSLYCYLYILYCTQR